MERRFCVSLSSSNPYKHYIYIIYTSISLFIYLFVYICIYLHIIWYYLYINLYLYSHTHTPYTSSAEPHIECLRLPSPFISIQSLIWPRSLREKICANLCTEVNVHGAEGSSWHHPKHSVVVIDLVKQHEATWSNMKLVSWYISTFTLSDSEVQAPQAPQAPA